MIIEANSVVFINYTNIIDPDKDEFKVVENIGASVKFITKS
jgi:hypothetical protein